MDGTDPELPWREYTEIILTSVPVEIRTIAQFLLEL
jgi:hypothetical protein